jgi:ferritin
MHITGKMTEGLNAQIGREYSASLQYLAMAAWFEAQGLKGLSGFFHKQAEEESGHGLKIVKYLGEVGGEVSIPEIPKPRADYDSVQSLLADFLKMEEEVTRAIYALVELAQKEKDHSAYQFLQWYVEEQREEVASAHELLTMAERFGEERVFLMDGAFRRA